MAVERAGQPGRLRPLTGGEADVHSQGESEVIVGTALAVGRRDDVILATEFHPRWTFR
jgi:hypothetical protein